MLSNSIKFALLPLQLYVDVQNYPFKGSLPVISDMSVPTDFFMHS